MLAPLRRELEMRLGHHPRDLRDPEYDPFRECKHTPDQVYTHEPCSCGRPCWPPRGRGRGESLTSPRRIAALERAQQAATLYADGWTYEAIAKALGFADKSGAWRALQRRRDYGAAWSNYHDRRKKKSDDPWPWPTMADVKRERRSAQKQERLLQRR